MERVYVKEISRVIREYSVKITFTPSDFYDRNGFLLEFPRGFPDVTEMEPEQIVNEISVKYKCFNCGTEFDENEKVDLYEHAKNCRF